MADRIHKITSLGNLPREQTRAEQTRAEHPLPENQPTGDGRTDPDDAADAAPSPRLVRGIDRVLAIQRPVVLAHIRGIRRRNPDATPTQIVRILERRYLAAVTTGGAAVGATAVIPGISTGITLALSGAETAGFLEATSLFAQSVAEVHGIAVTNPERARALVMTLMLGKEGTDLVRQLGAQVTGGAGRNVYWGELVTNTMPKALVGPLVDRLKSAFIKQFAARGGASFIGKAIPFGIGAAIGGTGNHILGRRVLTNSRLAFGQPPAQMPFELEPAGESVTDALGHRIVRAGSTVGSAVAGAAGATSRSVASAGRRTGRTVAGITRKALPKGRSKPDDGEADAP
jgi:hypothetical protein